MDHALDSYLEIRIHGFGWGSLVLFKQAKKRTKMNKWMLCYALGQGQGLNYFGLLNLVVLHFTFLNKGRLQGTNRAPKNYEGYPKHCRYKPSPMIEGNQICVWRFDELCKNTFMVFNLLLPLIIIVMIGKLIRSYLFSIHPINQQAIREKNSDK